MDSVTNFANENSPTPGGGGIGTSFDDRLEDIVSTLEADIFAVNGRVPHNLRERLAIIDNALLNLHAKLDKISKRLRKQERIAAQPSGDLHDQTQTIDAQITELNTHVDSHIEQVADILTIVDVKIDARFEENHKRAKDMVKCLKDDVDSRFDDLEVQASRIRLFAILCATGVGGLFAAVMSWMFGS